MKRYHHMLDVLPIPVYDFNYVSYMCVPNIALCPQTHVK